VAFARELWIERDDFMEEPPPKYFRLAPGREVRLRSAYFVTCTDVVKDADGRVVELRCTYDPATRGGDAPDGRRPKATLHWLSAPHALECEVRLYDRLFTVEEPGKGDNDYLKEINPASLETIADAKIEPSVAGAEPGTRCQFERLGYFCVDSGSGPRAQGSGLVFNRTVTLKDSWAKAKG
jgi:glutaminyl-tRNA synthetase